MVVRIWEGRTRINDSDVYQDIIEDRDIPYYKKASGFIKLSFLKRSDKDFTHFKLLTFWKDFDSIKKFTGPNFEKAVAYEEDRKYLEDFPGSIEHYEIFAE